MGVHGGLGDGQAQAQAAVLGREGTPSALLEGEKYPGQQLLFDADAVVLQVHADGSFPVMGLQRDATALGGELGRVLEQVPKDLLEPRRIAAHEMLPRVQLDDQFLPPGFDVGTADFDGVFHHGVQVNIRQLQLDFVVGDAAEVEEVVDQPGLKLDITLNHLEGALKTIRHLRIGLQGVDGQQDRRERRAQFVAEHGEELVLGTGCSLRLIPGKLGRFVEPGIFLRHPGAFGQGAQQFHLVLGPGPGFRTGGHGHGPDEGTFFETGHGGESPDATGRKKQFMPGGGPRVAFRVLHYQGFPAHQAVEQGPAHRGQGVDAVQAFRAVAIIWEDHDLFRLGHDLRAKTARHAQEAAGRAHSHPQHLGGIGQRTNLVAELDKEFLVQLHPLAIRHVHRHPGEAFGLSVRTGKKQAARFQPGHLAGSADDAEFHLIRSVLPDATLDLIHHPPPVLGMNEPLKLGEGAAKFRRRETINILCNGRPGEDAGAQIPLPRAQPPGFERDFQPLLAFPPRFIRRLAGPARFRLAQLALHGRGEPGQPVLHHVIVRPALHRGDGHILADVPGDNDDGNVVAGLVQELDRGRRAELGHDEVGNDQIPLPLGQSGAHSLSTIHPHMIDEIAAAAQFEQDQIGVVFRILDQQQVQRPHAFSLWHRILPVSEVIMPRSFSAFCANLDRRSGSTAQGALRQQ